MYGFIQAGFSVLVFRGGGRLGTEAGLNQLCRKVWLVGGQAARWWAKGGCPTGGCTRVAHPTTMLTKLPLLLLDLAQPRRPFMLLNASYKSRVPTRGQERCVVITRADRHLALLCCSETGEVVWTSEVQCMIGHCITCCNHRSHNSCCYAALVNVAALGENLPRL